MFLDIVKYKKLDESELTRESFLTRTKAIDVLRTLVSRTLDLEQPYLCWEILLNIYFTKKTNR